MRVSQEGKGWAVSEGRRRVRVKPDGGAWAIETPGTAPITADSFPLAMALAGAALRDMQRPAAGRPRAATANAAGAKRAKALHAQGLSLRQIARALATEGLAGTSAKPVSPDSVRRLLGKL